MNETNATPAASRGLKGKLAQLRNATVVDRRQIQAQTVDIVSDDEFMAVYERCREFTMTSIERMYGLFNAVRYVSQSNVAGDIVETGVWRGGSSMLIAETLRSMGDDTRTIWLYDTYEGMAEPTELDVAHDGQSAKKQFEITPDWCAASVEEVTANMAATGYPEERFRFVKGLVQDTIPNAGAPDSIALLRLDTDWYESSKHELENLYPRLTSGGVLVLDDYGHWAGVRKSVDEYLSEHGVKAMLQRLDYAGRLLIKP